MTKLIVDPNAKDRCTAVHHTHDECTDHYIRLLRKSDLVAVLATDVGQYYASHGVAAMLPIDLPCKMDAFGLITRTDRLLSPAAEVMLRAIKLAALNIYGVRLSGVGPATVRSASS